MSDARREGEGGNVPHVGIYGLGGVGEVVVGLEILLGELVGGVGDLGGEGGGGHVDCGGVVVVVEKKDAEGGWLLS